MLRPPDEEVADSMKTTNGNLRVMRELRGLTQEELAALIDRTQKSVSAFEVGRRRPSAPVRKRLATILI